MKKQLKPVLQFKFNKEEFNPKYISAFMQFAHELLDEDYYIITCPFELEIIKTK